MRIRVKCCVSAILLLLVLFAVMGMFFDEAGATGSGDYPPPGSGDWIITTDTVVWNETIFLDGNLTVEYGATLTLKNVTLIVNSSSTRDYRIEVKRGATMIITDWDDDNTTTYDASNITAVDANYGPLFWVRDGSNFTMRNSELHRCGGWALQAYDPVALTYGLYIETDNATIDHNLISYNYMGIVLYGSDATVSNNTITWNDDTGIFAGYWSNATIENNWITWNYKYGIWITGGGSTNTKPSNPTVIGNVITDTGRGSNTADGLTVEFSSNPFIENMKILRSTEDAIYSGDSSTPTLINITIDGANYGIASSATGYLYIYNTTISNTNLYDLSIQGAPGSFFIVTNSTFNENKIIIDSSGNLTVRWYLHVLVRDSNLFPIPGADVRIKDNANGTYNKNFTTDVNGYVKWIALTEYWENSTTKIYYTPYNISVNYTGLTFLNNPRNSTINTSKTEIFTATTPVPEFESIIVPLIFTITVCILFIKYQNTKKRPKNERK